MSDFQPEPVTLTFRKQTFEVTAGMTVRDAVIKCGFNPETVLAVRASELVTDDTYLKPGDTIKLVATISGG
ncbi:MAG: MoaD/ThiS family protein [Anaerolineae bacterium]|nr:MoaD/ThiS family protein [Anaerolineae bacterium]